MGAGPAVLVTGAAGYVGRLCVAALAERASELSAIVALDWTETTLAERIEGVTYEHGDICDPALKDLFRRHGIDTVIHLASIVRAPKGAPKDLAYRVDVLGTKNVLEACEAVAAKRLIVTSSGAAYGYHPDNPDWLDEDDPLRGTTSSSIPRTNGSSRKCSPSGVRSDRSFARSCFGPARSSGRTSTAR